VGRPKAKSKRSPKQAGSTGADERVRFRRAWSFRTSVRASPYSLDSGQLGGADLFICLSPMDGTTT